MMGDSIPVGWKSISLAEIGVNKPDLIDPADSPETLYELWSVPSFATGAPERTFGSTISSSKQRVQPGDVLLCKINPRINRVWCVAPVRDTEQIASTEWIVFRNEHLDPYFLVYQLREGAFRKKLLRDVSGVGGSLMRARPQTVKKLQIAIPSLPEQRRIVAKIEALQERSRKARAALEAIPPLLEQFRQSVLAAAFRGDLTADWRAQHPDVEPASVLLDRIRAERRRHWEEAELAKMQAKGKMPKDEKWKERYEEPEPVDETEMPELPEGWCWARWDEVGRCQNGRAFPSKEYAVQGVKLLRPGNLHVSGTVRWTEGNARYLPNSWADEYPDFMVRGNELVMNLTAQSLKDEFLGRVCLSDESEECLLNQRIARLTPTLLSSRFCLWLFKSPVFRRFVDGLNTGSLIQHMFTSQVLDFRFPVPPMEEQNAIVNSVEQALKSKEVLAESLEAALSQSNILDQSILAKAFRGELVPQDPNDEPASVLLERIRTEREAQSAKPRAKKKTPGSTKHTKKAPPVSVNENDALPLFNSLQK